MKTVELIGLLLFFFALFTSILLLVGIADNLIKKRGPEAGVLVLIVLVSILWTLVFWYYN